MAYDIRLSGGDIVAPPAAALIDGRDRIAQQIMITLGFWLGEWFLDETQGVPYLERILVKNPNMAHVRQIIQTQIESVPGVASASIDSVYMDRQQRTAQIIYTAQTTAGEEITKEVTLGGNG